MSETTQKPQKTANALGGNRTRTTVRSTDFKSIECPPQSQLPKQNAAASESRSVTGAADKQPNPLRVLIACEYSGIVRDAFRAQGHDAWSCDILCCARGPAFHLRQDAREVLGNGWDLMVAHPPCTYLSWAGTAWWNDYGRKEKREAAMKFFMDLYNAPIPRVAIENPKGFPGKVFRAPCQTINPYQFGESRRKRICLWLRGLPLLVPTNEVTPEPAYFRGRDGKARHWVDAMPPSPTRQQKRSKFFKGIAAAMAQQWGTAAESKFTQPEAINA